MKIEILNSEVVEDNTWFLDQVDIKSPYSVEISFSRKKDKIIERFKYLLFNVHVNQCDFKCSPFFGAIKNLEIIDGPENLKQCLVYLSNNHKLDFTFEDGVKIWKD